MKLAVLILVAGVKRVFVMPSRELVPLHEKLLAVFRLAPRIDMDFSELALWTITTAALMREEGQRDLHVTAITRLMRDMGIGTGEEVIAITRDVLWVRRLTDAAAATLVSEIDRSVEVV